MNPIICPPYRDQIKIVSFIENHKVMNRITAITEKKSPGGFPAFNFFFKLPETFFIPIASNSLKFDFFEVLCYSKYFEYFEVGISRRTA